MANETEQIASALPSALPPREEKRQKSPGRVAAGRRLNELGLRGPGGRMPVHGLRALEGMLARGQTPEGRIGQLLGEFEAEFLGDLGGREAASAKERGMCRRLAELELFIGLVKARLTTGKGGPRRLPWASEKDLLDVHGRLAERFGKICEALGLERRTKSVGNIAEYYADLHRRGLADQDEDEPPADGASGQDTGKPADGGAA